MTRPGVPDGPTAAEYEIVVRGAVGQVRRAALLPLRSATVHGAVLRARLRPGRGLADLVVALDGRGLRVTSVERVHPPEVMWRPGGSP